MDEDEVGEKEAVEFELTSHGRDANCERVFVPRVGVNGARVGSKGGLVGLGGGAVILLTVTRDGTVGMAACCCGGYREEAVT